MKRATRVAVMSLIESGKSFRLSGPEYSAPSDQYRMGAIKIPGGWIDFAIFASSHPNNLDELISLIEADGRYTILAQ